jgi:hypothetical protein
VIGWPQVDHIHTVSALALGCAPRRQDRSACIARCVPDPPCLGQVRLRVIVLLAMRGALRRRQMHKAETLREQRVPAVQSSG